MDTKPPEQADVTQTQPDTQQDAQQQSQQPTTVSFDLRMVHCGQKMANIALSVCLLMQDMNLVNVVTFGIFGSFSGSADVMKRVMH